MRLTNVGIIIIIIIIIIKVDASLCTQKKYLNSCSQVQSKFLATMYNLFTRQLELRCLEVICLLLLLLLLLYYSGT